MGDGSGRPGLTGQRVWFGGDYNPGQWPEGTVEADLGLMAELGVDTVTLPVFSWARLQPAKGRFEFGWLDRLIETLTDAGIGLILATPTAAQPAWMSAAYPEILPVDAAGTRRRHGGRVNYCPTSDAYRGAIAEVAGAMAERYGGREWLRLWHVNNEYGPVCHCDGCRAAFAAWAEARHGDLDGINGAWGTEVWGHTLGDLGEIELPSARNAMVPDGPGLVHYAPNPSLALDHARFVSDVLLECYLIERRAIAGHAPDDPVTTNFHGPIQAVDWQRWGPHLDIATWDSYPRAGEHWSVPAFGHALARGAKQGDELIVMEASPGAVNWHELCALKRPGVVALEAHQAVAAGSLGMLYFQVRQARAGAELHHAALIPRHGRLDTRTGRELVRLGGELSRLAPMAVGAQRRPRAALLVSWPAWWSHHNTPGLDQRSRYLDTARSVHRELVTRHLDTDVVGPGAGLDRYEVVVAPLLHLVTEAEAEALAGYVAAGGTLITTAGSALVDGNGQVPPGGVEPVWRELFGLWIEETDVQPAGHLNPVVFAGTDGATAAAEHLFDLVRTEDATVVARFGEDFYAGWPAVTENRYGTGRALHVATVAPGVVGATLDLVLGPADDDPVGVAGRGEDLEVHRWYGDDGSVVVWLLNHGADPVAVELDGPGWIDQLAGTALPAAFEVPPAAALVARRNP